MKLSLELHNLTMSCEILAGYKRSFKKIFLLCISTLPHFQAVLSRQIHQEMERDRPGSLSNKVNI